MGRNEIRLRRQSISEGNIHRHRNYSALMRKHGRYLKLKRILYVLYVVVFVILFLLLFIVVKLKKEQSLKKPKKVEMSMIKNEIGVLRLIERQSSLDGVDAPSNQLDH